MDYLVVIERASDGTYSAYLPDLPGCVACGDTLEEAQTLIRQAVQLHIQSLRQHNEPIPPPALEVTVHSPPPPVALHPSPGIPIPGPQPQTPSHPACRFANQPTP